MGAFVSDSNFGAASGDAMRSQQTELVVTDLDREGVMRLAARFAGALAAAPPASIVVGLSGPLGVGKTTFVQGMVAALPGGQGLYVASPTYAILQTYDTRPVVRHGDLYRLGSLEDLEEIGYLEALEEPGLSIVEWIRRVPKALPREWLEIDLSFRRGDHRDVRVCAHGAWPRTWLGAAPLDEHPPKG